MKISKIILGDSCISQIVMVFVSWLFQISVKSFPAVFLHDLLCVTDHTGKRKMSGTLTVVVLDLVGFILSYFPDILNS